MYFGGGSWTGGFIVAALICGVVGWGVIETLRWLFSFIHISIG
jgi:hypothetical protein